MSADPTPQARGADPSRSHPTSTSSLGREAPRMPRRYGQWAGAVLFVVMSVLLAGWFWQQRDDRVAVLAVTGSVSSGETITRADLRVVEVSGVEGAIASVNSNRVIGKTAAVGLVEGQVLTDDMVTADPFPAPGERVVGLQLDATRVPIGLVPGDVVTVIAVPPAGDPGATTALDSPVVLAPHATVASAELIEGAGTRLTLLVPEAVGERVAAYIAAGRVALLQAPIGGD